MKLSQKVIVVILFTCSFAVRADTVADVVSQQSATESISQSKLEENIDDYFQGLLEISPTEPTERDIILLESQNPWYMRVNLGAGYDTNALRLESKHSNRDDYRFRGGVTLGADTVIADKFYVYAEATYDISRYDKFGKIDNDRISGATGVLYSIDNFLFGASYQVQNFKSRWFGGDIVDYHSIGLNALWRKAFLKNYLFSLPFSYSRNFAHQNDYSSNIISIAPEIKTSWNKFIFSVSGDATYVHYDDFFTPILKEHRRDGAFGTNIKISYPLLKGLDISVSARKYWNISSIEQFNYDGEDVKIGLNYFVHF